MGWLVAMDRMIFTAYYLFTETKSDRMRKTTSRMLAPVLQPPSISKTLKHYRRNSKKATSEKKPEQPTEETIHRLNNIGKTYPFCVYYRPQTNDPL
jgi:hypothetical protein